MWRRLDYGAPMQDYQKCLQGECCHLACRRCRGVIKVPTENDQRIPLACAAGTIACCTGDVCGSRRQTAHYQLGLKLPSSFIGLYGTERLFTLAHSLCEWPICCKGVVL